MGKSFCPITNCSARGCYRQHGRVTAVCHEIHARRRWARRARALPKAQTPVLRCVFSRDSMSGFPQLNCQVHEAIIGSASESSAILKLSFRSLVVTQVESNSVGQLVKSSSDYCRLCEVSLSSDQPIMLALKKFIPCYAAALFIKTHSALLALCGGPHNASSRTGMSTWLLPSVVHMPRNAALKASCC